MINKQEVLKEFEAIKNMAEFRSLMNYSLEHPLTDEQYKRVEELKHIIFKK